MSFNRTESALFQQEADKTVGELHAGVDKALAEAASRGYAAAPGDTLAAILGAGQTAKGKLTEANGKIYDARRKTLFEQDEFAMKLIVSLSKLGMELYRAELLNALELEQAENIALRDQGLADVVRMNAEVDLRQRAIIQARAEAEHRITVLKAQLVAAEEGTLVYEAALINAQISTAERKLEIIASIYEVLAAEELVLAAENRRAATLVTLLAAEQIVAQVKKAMIPYYIEKAGARVELADAITKEIPFTKALIELGYDRIDLETQRQLNEHLLRKAEGELELAHLELTRANEVTQLTRVQSQRLLVEYSNAIQIEILALKKALAEAGIDLRLDTALQKLTIGVDDDIEVNTAEILNTGEELTAIVAGLAARAKAQADAISSGKSTNTSSYITDNLTRKISGG